jgi:hypothetical protein
MEPAFRHGDGLFGLRPWIDCKGAYSCQHILSVGGGEDGDVFITAGTDQRQYWAAVV